MSPVFRARAQPIAKPHNYHEEHEEKHKTESFTSLTFFMLFMFFMVNVFEPFVLYGYPVSLHGWAILKFFGAKEIEYPLAESAESAEVLSASSAALQEKIINWSFPDNQNILIYGIFLGVDRSPLGKNQKATNAFSLFPG